MTQGKIKRQTAKDEVLQRLREMISTGQFKPGEKLNLKVVSEMFGVSMTPVREAFEQLTADGMLVSDAFRGVRVSRLSPDEYEEIYLQRAGLDCLAHRLGSGRITDAQCEALEDCLEQMSEACRAGDVAAFIRFDRKFHEVIYDASGRERLKNRLVALRHAADRYTRAVFRMPRGGMEDTIRSHREILAACRSHDGATAERIIAEDMRLTFESYAEYWAQVNEDETENEG